jgi:hypothetical protein
VTALSTEEPCKICGRPARIGDGATRYPSGAVTHDGACPSPEREERDRCAKIVANLGAAISVKYTDPNPKYSTSEAAFELCGRLTKCALDAIREGLDCEGPTDDPGLAAFIAEQEARLGTPLEAITFALDELEDHYDRQTFLDDWRTGKVTTDDEWSDYWEWLSAQRKAEQEVVDAFEPAT